MAVMKNEWRLDTRIATAIFLTLSFLASLFALQKGMGIFNKEESEKIIYTYAAKGGETHKIKLKENSFIQEEYLGEGQTYISDLVDYIDFDFDYTFYGSNESEISYTYEIYVDLQIKYRTTKTEDTKMWHKKYPIKNVSDKVFAKEIVIEENEKVDYNYYNQKAIEFFNQFQLPIEAELGVVMEVRLDGEYGEQSFKDTYTQKAQMPVSTPAFTITKAKMHQEQGVVIEIVKTEFSPDLELSQWGIALMIMALSLFVIFFEKIFNIKRRSTYEKEKNKILKEYGDIIIETKSPLARAGLAVMEVKSFKEMLDLEEELRIPIMFFENEAKEYGEFSLLHQKILYIFEI